MPTVRTFEAHGVDKVLLYIVHFIRAIWWNMPIVWIWWQLDNRATGKKISSSIHAHIHRINGLIIVIVSGKNIIIPRYFGVYFLWFRRTTKIKPRIFRSSCVVRNSSCSVVLLDSSHKLFKSYSIWT